MQAWSGLSISNPTLTLTPAVWKSFHLFAFLTLWPHLKKTNEIIVETAIPGPCSPQGIKSFPPLHYLPPCTQSTHPAQLCVDSGSNSPVASIHVSSINSALYHPWLLTQFHWCTLYTSCLLPLFINMLGHDPFGGVTTLSQEQPKTTRKQVFTLWFLTNKIKVMR